MNNRKREKKKFVEFEHELPIQLSLFELLDPVDNRYSQSVELYDAIPKYVVGKTERIDGQFLNPIERVFECNGVKYQIVLFPARIKSRDKHTSIKENIYRDHFPGKREEIVEDALRKMLVSGNGIFLNEEAGLKFSLYALQAELIKYNHTYSYPEITESLEILAKTDIEIISEDKNTKVIFSPIECLGLSGIEGETQTFVKFSPLVTLSIRKLTFRLFDYEKVMKYRTTIARRLHRRLAANFTQAAIHIPYSIKATTIIRDFGLTHDSRFSSMRQRLLKALKELEDSQVVLSYTLENVLQGNKVIDIVLKILPTHVFVNDIIEANKRAKTLKRSLLE
jgi:hypothetical protein